MPLSDIAALAACPALILIFLRACNASDRAEAAAWRRGEEIGRAYRQGLADGIAHEARGVNDQFVALMVGRIKAHARRQQDWRR